MAGYSAILDAGGPLADEDLRGHEGFAAISHALPGHPQGASGAQTGGQFAAQRSAALPVQRLVDRFMADAHRNVFGEIHQQTVGDLLRALSLRPSAGLSWSMAALPLDLQSCDRFAIRRRDVAGQPLLKIFTQYGVRQQLGRLRTQRCAVDMPLRRVGSVFKAAATGCSVLPQLPRDRRWRSKELPGNLPNTFSTGNCQVDLLTLGEAKVSPCGRSGGRGKVGKRHTAALSEPASSDGLGHTGNRGCVLAGVPLRNSLPQRPSLGTMQNRQRPW